MQKTILIGIPCHDPHILRIAFCSEKKKHKEKWDQARNGISSAVTAQTRGREESSATRYPRQNKIRGIVQQGNKGLLASVVPATSGLERIQQLWQ